MGGGQELASMDNTGPQQDGSRFTSTMWACGAASQAVGSMVLHKRGDGGPSMPLRAFSIASLILGAGVCFVGGALHASGIRESWFTPGKFRESKQTSKHQIHGEAWMSWVNDLVSTGQKIRVALGKPPRTHS